MMGSCGRLHHRQQADGSESRVRRATRAGGVVVVKVDVPMHAVLAHREKTQRMNQDEREYVNMLTKNLPVPL